MTTYALTYIHRTTTATSDEAVRDIALVTAEDPDEAWITVTGELLMAAPHNSITEVQAITTEIIAVA